jgi:hypothetical protein
MHTTNADCACHDFVVGNSPKPFLRYVDCHLGAGLELILGNNRVSVRCDANATIDHVDLVASDSSHAAIRTKYRRTGLRNHAVTNNEWISSIFDVDPGGREVAKAAAFDDTNAPIDDMHAGIALASELALKEPWVPVPLAQQSDWATLKCRFNELRGGTVGHIGAVSPVATDGEPLKPYREAMPEYQHAARSVERNVRVR